MPQVRATSKGAVLDLPTEIMVHLARMRLRIYVLVSVALSVLSFPAAAGPHDIVVHVTRLGGDATSAQPYIDKFLRYLEEKAGWEKGSASGVFAPQKAEALAAIDDKKPGLVLLEPNVFLELRKAKKLEALVQVESKELTWPKL